MQIKWVKLCTDIFDDEKILLIESMPDADSIIVIWFKLLCFAGKQNNGGVFLMNDRIAYTDEMLSTIFRRPLSVVRMALKTFESFGMVEIINNAYTIPNWEKHQNIEGMDKIREQNRLRKQKQREKAKIPQLCDGHVTVTQCHAPEEDKEEDKDKNKNKKISFVDSLLSDIEDDDLRNLYLEYIAMRKAIKSPITTERALKMLINKVNTLEPTDIERQKKLLENAVVGNWKSVYPLKEEAQTTNTTASYDLDQFRQQSLHGELKYERKNR